MTDLQAAARDHLWMHFTRHSTYENGGEVPMIVRGDGAYIYDDQGKRYLDGLSGLFVVQAGHGRQRAGRGRRASRPPSSPSSRSGPTPTPRPSSWPSGSPRYAPGDLNRVFFTTGGGEAVETAWKLAKQYFKLTGKPSKHKVISRARRLPRHPAGRAVDHRHPGAQGSRSSRWCPAPPGAQHQHLPAPPDGADGDDPEAFGRWAADRIEEAIEFEGPDTVAAVFLEPVQNAGGCFPPPPGYFQRVREICDKYDVLLVSDEVICAFGRLGDHVRLRRLRLRARHHHLRQGPDLAATRRSAR